MKKTIIIMLCIQALFAEVPHKMSFQAYLTDNNNMPVAPGNYEITFRIYDAKTDGNKIWEETQTVHVDGSMVNAMLGTTVPLVPLQNAGFLEIQLQDEILNPRQEIGISMYALEADLAHRAEIADTAPGYAKLDTLSFYAKTGDIVANTDNQSLSLSGDSLYISNGNGVSLNHFKDTFTDTDTDDQSLRISGDTLYISEGNSVSLASYKDTFTDTDTDDQSLRISGDTLYISEGNAVSLANFKDNADTQDLSISGNTISLVDGGSVDVSAATAVAANTAKTGITSDQASAIIANTGKTGITTDQATAIVNNTAKVGVPTAYTLPSADGSSSQVLQTDGSGTLSWATAGGGSTSYLPLSGGSLTGDITLTNGDAFRWTSDDVRIEGTTAGDKILFYAGGTERLSIAQTGGATFADNISTSGTITAGAITIPNTDGSANQVLQTDGSGTLSWATASGGGASDVNGLTDALVEDNSLYIGNDPSSTTSTAVYNVAVGTTALDAVTTGAYNVAVGANALTANTTGQRNTASGYKALSFNTTGQRNTGSGMEALSYNTTGTSNTATGFYALRSNTTGGYNTANGYEAGDLITTGSNNVMIGSGADPSANNATNQIVIGYNATGAGDNTVQLGNTSITNVKTSGSITAGAITIPNTDGTNGQVLQTDGSGTLSWATASGGSGASDVDGLSDGLVEDNSIYIGNDPSSTTSTAEYNVAVGTTALDAITTGDNNVAVGYGALTSNTTGYWNAANGVNSLGNNTEGFSNTANGYAALINNTTGFRNTANGKSALNLNSTGSRNTANGVNALYSNTTGGYNAAFGVSGLKNVTTGNYNTSLGNEAGDLITTGSNNVVIGSGADPSANNATNQIVIGYNATGAGDNTVQLGNTSITNVKTSGSITAGAITIPNTDGTNGQVLQTDGSGTLSWATASGGSGASDVDGLSDALVEHNSIYIGNDPSSTTNIAQYNVAVGTTALQSITTGDYSVAIGYQSSENNTTGANNVSVGAVSLRNNVSGERNSAIGYASMNNNTGDKNTALGAYSLFYNTSAGYNTAIGYSALQHANRTADVNGYNTALGYDAGDTGTNDITTGDKNVLLGANTATSAATASNQIVIGYGATGAGDNTVQLGNTSITDVHTSGDMNAVAFNTTSDKRLKTNIAPLKVALAKVLKLNPVQYEKKRALDAKEYTLNEMGFLAQDVQKILPNIVKEGEDKDKLLSVNYIEIIPVLTKAIQEQQAQIEALQNQLQVLVAMQTQDANTVESTEGDQ